MRRGDLVTVALQGEHGKPRPALVIQLLATVQKCAYSLKSAGPSATRCRTGAPGVATRQAALRLLRFRYGPSGDEPQPQAQWAFQGRKETSGHRGRIREVNRSAVVKCHIYFQQIDAVFDRHLHQSDLFAKLTSTVTVVLLTSTALDVPLIRVPIEPSQSNGLRKRSYVMIDQIFSAGTRRIGPVFGHLDDADMVAVNRALALFTGIAS